MALGRKLSNEEIVVEHTIIQRIENIFNLWWMGMILLIPIALMLLGFKSFYDIFSQAFGIYIAVLGFVLIPISISLFILKKIPRED